MGYAVSIGLLALGMFIYAYLSLHLNYVNKRRKAGKEDHKIEGMTEEEVEALGDRNPRFIYTI